MHAGHQRPPNAISRMRTNSSEKRWAARLVSASQSCVQSQGFVCGHGLGEQLTGRFKIDEMRNRPRGWSAAKRAILKMIMSTRVMVEMMREHLCRESHGTYVQHKGRATPRHKADGHVSSKKEHGQQKAGKHALSPTIKGHFTHTLQQDSRRNGVCGICQLSHDFCHSLRADGVDLKVAALALPIPDQTQESSWACFDPPVAASRSRS